LRHWSDSAAAFKARFRHWRKCFRWDRRI